MFGHLCLHPRSYLLTLLTALVRLPTSPLLSFATRAVMIANDRMTLASIHTMIAPVLLL